mmetsp:Transcript_12158/g.23104  ORF Transcript_12158/g.23104 Transcript_12158/m.23104 type:complete len:381 (-) Transcript_12158:280-1422(-)
MCTRVFECSLHVTNRVINSLGKMGTLRCRQARHADAPILGHIHVMFVGHVLYLCCVQAGECEHANLVQDVRPVSRGTQTLEFSMQPGTHVDDARCHHLQLHFPRFEVLRVPQNTGSHRGSVGGRVGVHRTNHQFELALHALGVVAGPAHDGQRAHALAVQAHVLGEALAHDGLHAGVHKAAHRLGVAVQVAARKALVGRVEQREQALLRHDAHDASPLLWGRVHAGGVVGARVQQDDAAVGSRAQIRAHALKVQPPGRGVVVPVLLDGAPPGGEDFVVVAPGGVGEEHRSLGRELCDELGRQPQGAGAGEALHGGDAPLRNGARAAAQDELAGQLAKLGVAPDGQVLLVSGVVGHQFCFSLTHDLKHKWLPFLCPVCTNT